MYSLFSSSGALTLSVPYIIMFMQISNGFAFLHCRGWIYAKGVCNPNGILGVLIRQNFLGLVQLPVENSVPEPGLHWEHYVAAQAPANTIINGAECHTRADMVLNGFWVIYLLHNKNLKIAS